MKFQINFRFLDSNTELLPNFKNSIHSQITITNLLIMMSEMYSYTKNHQGFVCLDNVNILFAKDPCVLI